MANLPLHHVVRIRTSEDLGFVRPGLMDELMVNANLLEHCPDSTASALEMMTLPYCIAWTGCAHRVAPSAITAGGDRLARGLLTA